MEPLVRVPSVPASTLRVPPQLEGLRKLAYNLWWSWHPRPRNMFGRIDARAWARYRNPIPVLAGGVPWPELLDDQAFMAEAQDILEQFERYLQNGSDHWFHRRHAHKLSGPIAYFCAEYGIAESLG